jgi:hypothetical protein
VNFATNGRILAQPAKRGGWVCHPPNDGEPSQTMNHFAENDQRWLFTSAMTVYVSPSWKFCPLTCLYPIRPHIRSFGDSAFAKKRIFPVLDAFIVDVFARVGC